MTSITFYAAFITFIFFLYPVLGLDLNLDASKRFYNKADYIVPHLNATDFLPQLAEDRQHIDGSFIVPHNEIPFMAILQSGKAGVFKICNAVLITFNHILTSSLCARQILYYARHYKIYHSGDGMQDTLTTNVRNAYIRSEHPGSKKGTDICVIALQETIRIADKENKTRLIKWPERKNGDMKTYHTFCVIYGIIDEYKDFYRAIIGKVLSTYECNVKYKVATNKDQFCLVVDQPQPGPKSLVGGCPVQCDGFLEGILTNPNNQDCNKTQRVYLVTRFDMNYDFIYRSSSFLITASANVTTTDESSSDYEAVTYEPNPSSLFQVFYKIRQQIFKWLYAGLTYEFQEKHNIIWDILSALLMILALFGIILMIRTRQESRIRKSKSKLTSIDQIIKQRKLESSKKDDVVTKQLVIPKAYIIFYDPKKGNYYYPVGALSEKVLENRTVSTEPPEFLFDRKRKHYIDGNTGDRFVLMENPEVFRAERKNMLVMLQVEENKRIVKSTKVYLDQTNGYYYYPDVALWEPVVQERSIVKTKKSKKIPVKYNPETRDFEHTKTGELYWQVQNLREFQQKRRDIAKTAETEEAEDYAFQTPIFVHKRKKKYYIPKTATEEKTMIPRSTLTSKNPLFYDPKHQAFYNVSIGERYLELNSFDEFFNLRKEAQERLKTIDEEVLAEHSPIFYDVVAKIYYYPRIALQEEEMIWRKILNRKKPLHWDRELESFVEPITKLEYVQVESPSDFKRMREENRWLEKQEDVGEKPVFYDYEKDLKYYPAIFLEGLVEVSLKDDFGPPPIEYDEKKGYLVNVNTKEKYIAVSTNENINDIKEKLQQNRERKGLQRRAMKTPIYYDPETTKYYYPEVAFLENDHLVRDIIEGPPPLTLDEETGLYTHRQTMEKYREFKSQEAFQKEWDENALRLDEEKDKIIADKTPIYYDKPFKKYYYPECALKEVPEMISRKTIKCNKKKKKLPLYYNERAKVYQHVETEKRYVLADNQEAFEDMRREALGLPPVKKPPLSEAEAKAVRQALADKTPIYQDKELGKYYYPVAAIVEEIETSRRIIKDPHPLVYSPQSDDYADPKTLERYIEVNDQDEFKAKREKYQAEVEMRLRKKAEKEKQLLGERTPIYYDEIENVYYYPECMLTEDEEIPRLTITSDTDSLPFKLSKRIYTNISTGERYIQVKTLEEFLSRKELSVKPAKKDKKEDKKAVVEQIAIPIYQSNNLFYYPELAFQEIEAEARPTVTTEFPLVKLLKFANLEEIQDRKDKYLNKYKSRLTPIFYNEEDNLYYYPEVALMEITTIPRETVTEIPDFELKDDGFIHPDGTKYYQVKSPEEFENMKIVTEVPALKAGSYIFYPENALISPNILEPEEWNLVIKNERIYYHPLSKVKYFEVNTPEEFGQLREEIQKMKLAEITPIYHDEGLEKYFYPEIALHENFDHDILVGPHPLVFDEESKTYKQPDTGEVYLECETLKEFKDERSRVLQEEGLPVGKPSVLEDTDVIYFYLDNYYFPVAALTELPEIHRTLKEGPIPLILDPLTAMYKDPNTGKEYVEVESMEKFQSLRKLKMEKETEPELPTICPIYYDKLKDLYYYPKIALKDNVDHPLIESPHPLILDPNKQCLVHPAYNNEPYLEIESKIKFEKMKNDMVIHEQETLLDDQIRQLSSKLASKTPIYKNEENDKLYYPEIALLEPQLIERRIETQVPLLYDQESGLYFHPETQVRYVEVSNLEEFSKMREDAKIAEEKRRVKIGTRTPIVRDNGLLYYPECALLEEVPIPRHIDDDFLLLFNAEGDFYYDEKTNEKYLEFETEAEFEKSRLKSLMVQKARELAEPDPIPSKEAVFLAIETPIYHDPQLSVYFYPVIATTEEPLIPRAIIESSLPKNFKIHNNYFIDTFTQEKYIQLDNPEEFTSLRDNSEKLTIEEIAQKRADEAPIYFNQQECFVPISALYEFGKPNRVHIKGTSELKYDPASESYTGQHGEVYIKLRSLGEFEEMQSMERKKRKNERLKKWTQQTPIYFDILSKTYYFPEAALEEPEDLHREILEMKGKIPITYNPQTDQYRKNITNEVYIKVENKNEFEELRNKTPKIVSSDLFWEDIPCKKYTQKSQLCHCPKAISAEIDFPSDDKTETGTIINEEVMLNWDDIPGEAEPDYILEEIPAEDVAAETLELALETPIYQDPDSGYFYYPYIAIIEEVRAPRRIIQNAPDFTFVQEEKYFFDKKTGWKYIQLTSEADLQNLRDESNKKPIELINEEKAQETPVYFDPLTQRYYYPSAAIYEITERPREVKEGLPPSISEYIKVRSESEFKELREKQIQERDERASRPKDSLRPVYEDPKTALLYYPIEAAKEVERLSRCVQKQTPPLKYDSKNKVYVHSITGEQYICVGSQKRFELVRRQTQITGKVPLQASPSTVQISKKKTLERTKRHSEEKLGPSDISQFWEETVTSKDIQGISLIDVPGKPEPEFHMEEMASDVEFSEDSKNLALETPIYHDPETDYYYYPQVASVETNRAPRKIIEANLVLQYDPKSELVTHVDPLTGWRYMELKSPTDFDVISQESSKKTYEQIREKKIADTPIYHDDETNLLYYPLCAINEFEERSRLIISGKLTLRWDPDNEVYRNPVGERYLEFLDDEEFQEMRDAKVRERLDEMKRIKARETPVYLDSITGEYYYPLRAAQEAERFSRDIFTVKPPLQFDPLTNLYYDPKTEEKYVIVRDPLKFEILRGMIQKGMNPPKQRPPIIPRSKKIWKNLRRMKTLEYKLAIDTPIYYDDENLRYFFPYLALKEEIPIPRRLIIDNPLTYDEFRDVFIDPSTGETYLQSLSMDQFEILRNEMEKVPVRELLRIRAKETPVYFNSQTRKYFYPDCSTYELEEMVRDVIKGIPPLVLDSATNTYRSPTGEPYITTETADELRRLKALRLSNRYKSSKHPGPEKTPIYIDPKTNHYFYPNIAFIEPQERIRDIVQRQPSLVWDSNLFAWIHTKCGEEYTELENMEQFLKLRYALAKYPRKNVVESSSDSEDEILMKSETQEEVLPNLKLNREFKMLSLETPIYNYDGCWYYPEVALHEKFLQDRETLDVKPPLEFNTYNNWFYHLDNNERYFVSTPDDFEAKRERSVKKTIKELLEEQRSPIYVIDRAWYYPERALFELDAINREIVNQELPLILDTKTNTYFHAITGEKYRKFGSVEEFKKQRNSVVTSRKEKLQKVLVEPIYFDNESQKYYYPKASLEETELQPRPVIYGKPSNLDNYFKLNSPMEFKQRRKKVQEKVLANELRLAAIDSPVYQDGEGQYYYPLAATREEKIVSREIKTENNLKVDANGQLYDPKTDEPYLKCGSPEEFKLVRKGVIDRLKVKKAKQHAENTPIYFEDGVFYYPDSSIQERVFLFRKLIMNKRDLFFDPEASGYVHVLTGERYHSFETPLEFAQIRRDKLEELGVDYQTATDFTPIYYDQNSGQFFYPRVAIEEKETKYRKIVTGVPNLYYHPNHHKYYELLSGEPYFQAYSPVEFRQMRKKAQLKILEECLKIRAQMTPIYFDGFQYYYPVAALEEYKLISRVLINAPLSFNPETHKYEHNGMTYETFESPEDFEKVREETVKILPEKMIEDPVPPAYKLGENFYFPKAGIEQDVEIKVEEEPSICLMYNKTTRIHCNPLTGDQFIRIKNLNDVEVLKNQIQQRLEAGKPQLVYHDTETKFYFYPASGLNTETDQIIECETPIVYLPQAEAYYHPESKFEYLRFLKPKEFEEHKLNFQARLRFIDIDPICTPIYYDPQPGVWYYPKRVIHETIDINRIRIFQRPFLYYDDQIFYDPFTGEEYLTAHYTSEIKYLKEKYKRKLNDQAPIFCDLDTNEFFFPKSAVDEVQRSPRRLMFDIIRPLQLQDGVYKYKLTGEEYIKVDNLYDFEKIRQNSVTEIVRLVQLRASQKNLPIYFEDGRWYIPKECLIETDVEARLILIGKPLVHHDAKKNILYDPWTGKQYRIFQNLQTFVQNRAQYTEEYSKVLTTTEKKRQKSTNSPIYYDPASGSYYYPIDAVEEQFQKYRETLKYRGTLKYEQASGLLIDVNTTDHYIKVNNEEEFIQLRQKGLSTYFSGKVKLEDEKKQKAVEETVNFSTFFKKEFEKTNEDVIFYDTSNSRYYYPKNSLTSKVPNKIITTNNPPIVFNATRKLYFTDGLSCQYLIFKSSYEFETLRAQMEYDVQLGDKGKELFPIFFDPKHGIFYYPLMNKIEKPPRTLIDCGKYPIYKVGGKQLYFNIEVQKYYVCSRNPSRSVWALLKSWWEIFIGISYDENFLCKEYIIPTFYYNPENGLYYHPNEGYEDVIQLRKMLIQKPPLIGYFESGYLTIKESFTSNIKHENQIQEVNKNYSHENIPMEENLDEDLSPETLGFLQEPKNRTPENQKVYFDTDLNEYFYPRTVILDLNPYEIIKCKTFLYHDSEFGLYFDNNDQYYKVKDPKDLEKICQEIVPDPVWYFNPGKQTLFFPIGLNISKLPYVIVGKEKLLYDVLKNFYIDITTGIKYTSKYISQNEIKEQLLIEEIDESKILHHQNLPLDNAQQCSPVNDTETEEKTLDLISLKSDDNASVEKIQTTQKRVVVNTKIQKIQFESANDVEDTSVAEPEQRVDLYNPLKIIPQTTHGVFFAEEQGDRTSDWGVDVPSFVPPEPKSRKIGRPMYYKVKSTNVKSFTGVVRRTTIYCNPVNMINDTMIPHGMYSAASICSSLVRKGTTF